MTSSILKGATTNFQGQIFLPSWIACVFFFFSLTHCLRIPKIQEIMNDCRLEGNPYCHFHPKQVVVGVCSHCLKERLLVLASKQGQLPVTMDSKRSFRYLMRKPTISRLKVFATNTFLHLLEPRQAKLSCSDGSYHDDDGANDEDSPASFEDSFISIKFEDNGYAAWDSHKTTSKAETSVNTDNTTSIKDDKETKSIVEHKKQNGRWRKKIGHLLQLARWKTSNKANTCHAGLGSNVDGFKGRRSWIRSLTRTPKLD